MTRIGIYPGTFDPPTRGHEDLIHRSLGFVDRLIVGVAQSTSKQTLFSLEERTAFLSDILAGVDRVTVQPFEGLLADFAAKNDACLVVRGLRAVADFEYEFQMALMNRKLRRELETIFLVPDLQLTFLSASLVREVASFGGDVSGLVHPTVEAALRRRFGA